MPAKRGATMRAIETVNVNQRVLCNGYEGTVTEVCTGQLKGMAVVRLDRGSVCVSISELLRAAKEPK